MIRVQPVTRHLWHVFSDETRIGAILRVNGARETVYQAQADGRAPERWESCRTFEDAQDVLEAIAAGCVAPDACSCSVCTPPAAAAEEVKPAAPAFASRTAALEID